MNARFKFKKIAVKAARLADAKKAESIAVYDLASRSGLADYVMAATVDSPVHLEAVDEEISGRLKKEGIRPLYRDGAQSKKWKVLDYGGLIIHLMERQTRLHYSLDRIFDGIKQVPWEAPASAPARKGRGYRVKGRGGDPAPAPQRVKKPAVKKAGQKASKAAKKAKCLKVTPPEKKAKG
ncbi:MAG: ribosome silencing factor [Elusimicrobia bacterium]|nr:ribosome silencing factor [Elusimicrobiota bacterium]